MPLLFIGDSRTKRKKELRNILGPSKPRRKANLSSVRKYVVEHWRSISAALVVASCVYTHVYYYNRLTVMNQQVMNLKAQIESGLQMRQNIVPALTMAVNRFIDHEKSVFLSAVKARESSLSISKDVETLTRSLEAISGKNLSPSNLSRFMAVAENYPKLVSNESYRLLIDQIADVENQIYGKRIGYNDAVNTYNTCLHTFPANIVGKVLAFRPEPYFEWPGESEWVFVADPKAGTPPLSVKSPAGGPEK